MVALSANGLITVTNETILLKYPQGKQETFGSWRKISQTIRQLSLKYFAESFNHNSKGIVKRIIEVKECVAIGNFLSNIFYTKSQGWILFLGGGVFPFSDDTFYTTTQPVEL